MKNRHCISKDVVRERKQFYPQTDTQINKVLKLTQTDSHKHDKPVHMYMYNPSTLLLGKYS